MSHLHHSTTTPLKRTHYISSLSHALLSGSWSSPTPGKAPNNSTPLDWTELVRKWAKHTEDDGVEGSLVKGLREVSLSGLPVIGLGGGVAGADQEVRGYDITGTQPSTSTIPNPRTTPTTTGDESAPSSSSSDQSNATATSAISNSTSSSSFIHVPHPHLPSALHRHKEKDRSASSPAATGTGTGQASGSSRLPPTTSGSGTTQAQTQRAISSGANPSLAIARTETTATSIRHSSPLRSTGPTNTTSSSGTRSAALPSAAQLDGDDTIQLALLQPPGCFSPPVGARSSESSTNIRTIAEHASSILSKRPSNISTSSAGAAKASQSAHHAHAHGKDVYDRAAVLLGYANVVLGEWEMAREVLEGVDYTGAGAGLEGGSETGTLSGDAMRLEYGRGRCLLGMACEVTRKGDALATYLSAVQILCSISTLSITTSQTFLNGLSSSSSSKLPSKPTSSTSATSLASFDSNREVYRWLSTALARATILTAQGDSPNVQETSRILRTYHLISKSWPAGFKPKQRSFMLSLYLRTLPAAHPSDSTVSSDGQDQFFLIPVNKKGPTPSRADMWQREVIDAIRVRQANLTESTSFPKAGEVNRGVERFVAECVGLWERSGCGLQLGREVVQILWWSMSLTFHSQPILRYLTRLLQATGSASDAKRTFELYVQLVLKARQTEQPDQPLRLGKRSTGDETAGPTAVASSGVPPEATDPPANPAQGKSHGDSDASFVRALLFGARLLSKDLDDPEDGWRYVVLAGDVLAQSRSKDIDGLDAKVEECKGIIRIAMAVADEDPLTRPVYQAQGLDHLAAATLLNPSSSALMYHLAYARAEARDVEKAVSAAHHALELDTDNIEAWHLLALLLTAQRDWQGAMKAVQAGIETWEQLEEELARLASNTVPTETPVDPNIQPKDFAVSSGSSSTASPSAPLRSTGSSARLLLSDGISPLPEVASDQLGTPPTASRRLARVIQLRMTQAVIVEKLEGPGAAMWRQQDTFSYFSARSGYSRPGGADASNSVVSGSIKDLGESYISVQPSPIDMGETVVLSPRGPEIVQTADQSTPREGSPDTSIAGETEYETDVDGKRKPKRLHLHVPGRHALKRTPSRGSVTPSEVRNRAVSNASGTTTPARSHYHGSTPTPPPPSQATKLATSGRSPAEIRVLSNLWLQSAATFRRWGKLEQALGAIQEAEVVDPENPEVWLQLGLYYIANRQGDSALDAFLKGLILRPDWPPITVRLAQHYLTMGQPDLAHGLLNPHTQGRGWDVPEAWYYLAKTCQAQGGREERVRECLVYSLQLEKGRTCRPVGSVLDRWL